MEILLWSLAVFFGRVADVSLGTIRINFIIRRKKIFAALIGFVEVTIFIFVISRVIKNLDGNLYGVLAYGVGFAVGTIVGMFISDKLTKDMVSINIISKRKSVEIESKLRDDGFGATSYDAIGRSGPLKVINVICNQSILPRLSKAVLDEDPNAFLNTHVLGSHKGGYLHGIKKK